MLLNDSNRSNVELVFKDNRNFKEKSSSRVLNKS